MDDKAPVHDADCAEAAVPRAAPRFIPFAIASGVVFVLLSGTLMMQRAESKTNQVALSAQPKPVSAVVPEITQYRAYRTYVGTILPWIEARIGPQLVSAYVDTVLVRPGDVVKKDSVIATLDCRNASALTKAVAMQARALEARQKAALSEASRLHDLLQGGFVSPNEAERKEALSASEQASVLAQQAKLLGSSLGVDDCVLRAPFDGEVARRMLDPGAFVQPGAAIVSLVDRSTLRITGEAPEIDVDVVKPGSKVEVHVVATGRNFHGVVARLSPAAGASTRAVHFELDVPDPERTIPVATTAELRIDVGTPTPALVVPLAAAAVRGHNASVYVVEGNVVHARVLHLQGELAGQLYLEPRLPADALIVTEGRELLSDGDLVSVGSAQTASIEPKRASASMRRTGDML